MRCDQNNISRHESLNQSSERSCKMYRNNQFLVSWLLPFVLLVWGTAPCSGQEPLNPLDSTNLPSAPVPNQSNQQPPSALPEDRVDQGNAGSSPLSLTLQQAESLAIKNNPQIEAARLIAMAAQQVTREARSNLWPTVTGALTGVDAQSGSRITAGALNNPIVYERAAAGVMVSQLITDFGRTSNLISSSNYAAKAENQNAIATQQQILLAVGQAFYSALQAQAVLAVAQQTVQERKTVADQVGALYKNKLKSELDFSFANVNLAQAQLLLLDAENNQNSALATLSMVLGFPDMQNVQLVEQTSSLVAPPTDVNDLISKAFTARPELLSLQLQCEAARKFQRAERDLLFPNIRAVGTVGDTPLGNVAVAPSPTSLNNTYGAVGANVEIPIFNGFLYTAKAREANLRAQATEERILEMRNLIARDVRTSWLNAKTAYQRLSVSQQLVEQAKLALSLAQSRYNLGLGSIVELSQAQLQQTQAEITYTQAGLDYRLSLDIVTYETIGIR